MRTTLIVLLMALVIPVAFGQSKVTKENVPGITNLARLETTVACAGAVKASAVAEIKKMGFKAIFNFRLATEQGADIEGETAAAKDAGIAFFHMPLSGSMPDPTVVDKFVKTIAEPGNQPAFIHCASGNRASALWYVKRVLVDKWEDDKAMAEATELGAMSAGMKTFVVDYVKAHRK
ncbi:MAG TPA: sulfur transferase domain-containing protein [Terriglobia bacterium]|nr:sulfur transferase domain-containing protein [Terriglobia bacterium]